MRLLFVTATRIGDAVLSTGALEHLRAQMPGVRVWVACGPAAAPLFGAVPGVERVIVMTKQRRAGHWIALWRAVVPHLWDHVVDLRGSGLAFTLLARRRTVAGKGRPEEHRLDHLARVLGLSSRPMPRIWAGGAAEAQAARLLPPGGPILALGPTANWWGKQWPADRFAALSAALAGPEGPLSGARIAVFGAANERDSAAPLLEAWAGPRLIDLIGRVSLPEAAAALARADLFVGNDSGLMHLAAAMGVPTLGLFGPSPEAVYGPAGPLARAVRGPRSYRDIVDAADFDHLAPRCYMEDLDVIRVEAAARELLATARRPKQEAALP